MSNEDELSVVNIQITGELDDEEKTAIAQQLRTELNNLPFVPSAEPTAIGVPGDVSGLKAGELVTIGVLALAILPQLIEFLKEWLVRPNARPVKLSVRTRGAAISAEYDPRTVTAEEIGRLMSQMKLSSRRKVK